MLLILTLAVSSCPPTDESNFEVPPKTLASVVGASEAKTHYGPRGLWPALSAKHPRKIYLDNVGGRLFP